MAESLRARITRLRSNWQGLDRKVGSLTARKSDKDKIRPVAINRATTHRRLLGAVRESILRGRRHQKIRQGRTR